MAKKNDITDNDRRAAAELAPQHEEALRAWKEELHRATMSDGQRRYEAWLAGELHRCRLEAAAAFQVGRPAPSIAAAADARMKANTPKGEPPAHLSPAERAEATARTEALHATARREAIDRIVCAYAESGRVVSIDTRPLGSTGRQS